MRGIPIKTKACKTYKRPLGTKGRKAGRAVRVVWPGRKSYFGGNSFFHSSYLAWPEELFGRAARVIWPGGKFYLAWRVIWLATFPPFPPGVVSQGDMK